MAEEQKPETTETEQTKSGQVVFNSQEDFDAVISRRLAKEKEKYSDYDATKTELDKLRQDQKKREEDELTEAELLKKQLEEKDGEIQSLKVYKDRQEEWEHREMEKIEKAMENLSDDDKELVTSLPLDKRMIMIGKLSNEEIKPTPPTTKPFKFNNEKVPTEKEYMEMRERLGWQHPETIKARNVMRKYEQGVI